MNLFAAEGDTWRKHRRVMGPAFNNELCVLLLHVIYSSHMSPYRYRLVWTQTMKTYRDMVTSEKWEGKASVSVPVIQELTFKVESALTLFFICLRLLSARPPGSWYLCFWFLIPVVCFTPFVGIVVLTLVNLQGMNLRGHLAEICRYKKQYGLLLTLTCCVFSRLNGC